ncbi:hypothetical protein GSI_08556 [Ganoderma sinense ZZ0214-1]|uniref:Uncharacterized protein n=1 Tax=Ganoderma sinense ZZ0214-1 TaxID=1077348 RepID=A0A2G8S4M3_9APHY|nr:hypothetical protein GSI_08556 [Ganoderma sinense ZZ0214-1]
MSSENWRKKPQTFSDEKNQVYTVTNVPPIIPPIAASIDADAQGNCSLGALLRPQLNIGCYPELAFVLRRLPVGDPLLSRVCVDPATLLPAQHEGGWALPDNIRNAWMRLEKGLLYVSELLMTSTEGSSCGPSARHAIRLQPHWSPPEDSGYTKLHRTPQGAQAAIRRAHVAFQLLIARCSLAIALWLFPGPRDGHVREVRTSHYNYHTDEVVPDWVQILTNNRVPSSWIDALSESVITDFSFNLRVGMVFDAKNDIPLPITPVLRAANVPVFILWGSPDETRACPDFAAVDQLTPPFGPYQLPGESRIEFFARREKFRVDQERQESEPQMQWRLARTAQAQSGLPPRRRSRMYLWVNAELVFPALPPQWHQQEYRYPIPPSAYRSIWMVHPAGYRQYNPFCDEWDLWFPTGWGTFHPEHFSETRSPEIQSDPEPSGQPVHHMPMSTQSRVNGGDVHQLLALDTSLLVAAPDDMEYDVAFPSNYHLGRWYGISITDSRTFPEVDYATWVRRLPQIFSEHAANLPQEPEQQSLLAGWVSAMLAGDSRSRALMHTWDLDPRNSAFLLRDGEVRSCISLEHLRAPIHIEETDNIVRWVMVKFNEDVDNGRWSLITTVTGALWLARRLTEATTASNAMHSLVSVGVPFRTAILQKRPPPPMHEHRLESRMRMLPPWRAQGHRPTVQDYESYCQRVLELAARPHARAAWLKGGIVWRIMRHVTGREHPLANQDGVEDGPSVETPHHVSVTIEKGAEALYDDGLSLEELDMIAGVVRVYTEGMSGIHHQTEDASWWPKHSAWVRGGAYTGIWTPWQEHWFQERLRGILAGSEGPLNATQWKDKLKGFKKAGHLADRVEEASWNFTYRNFVSVPEAH